MKVLLFTLLFFPIAQAQVLGPSCYYNGQPVPSVLNNKGQLACPSMPVAPSAGGFGLGQMAPMLLMGGMQALQADKKPGRRGSPSVRPPKETTPVAQPPVDQQTASEAPNPVVSGSLADMVAMPTNCKNEVDPITGYQLVLPKFSFNENRRCLYQRNQAYLSRLAQGCDNAKDIDNQLFTTKFRSTDGHYLLGQSDGFESIVENMSVVEKNGDSTIYRLQMLKPNTNQSPMVLERINVDIKKVGEKTFILNRDMSVLAPVKIENMVRRNILTEHLVAERQTLQRWVDGKLTLATNCKLSEQLRLRGLYRVGGSPPSTTPSSTATPVRSSK